MSAFAPMEELLTCDGSSAAESRLYADVVFDRPFDHAYTYWVPENLRARVGIGQRVEAPLGRGDRATVGYCIRLSDQPPPREVKGLLGVVDDQALLGEPLLRLTRWMADYYLCSWGQVLHAVVPAAARERVGIREEVRLEAIPLAELRPPLLRLSPKQTQALAYLRRAAVPMTPREIAAAVQCGTGPILALIDKGFARQSTHQVERYSGAITGQSNEPAWALNADQQQAWRAIRERLEARCFHGFLLHGVTGSGKTEVYLRAIEFVIARGQQAIVLVPEISLTPQTIERFRGRCGSVAVLHSHLTEAERGGHWRSVAAGQVQVVVGARSAVFAPTRHLGLIVLDEEHESSFKQESTPRYHARDVALMRAKIENCPILLGSATPSLESWHHAQNGQLTLLNLPARIMDRPLPPVERIDMRREPPSRGKYHAISPTLEKAIHEALNANGQVMLLLNRRGYSTHIHCPSCGFVATCQNCDLALTYHRHRSALICHHCGFTEPPPENCPRCQSAAVRYHGLGTEKLQAEVEEKFPGRVVQRMDSDTMQKPGSHQRVLDAFKDGLIHILLGTQMIAKGLDFPNVTLVGVVNADVGLHLPDFRSAERTFQLLAQVAGRTGRGEHVGRVLVQTFTPDHPCVAHAARHDYLTFAAAELAQRHVHGYPPFQHLIRLIIRSRHQDAALGFATTLAGAFRRAPQMQSSSLRLLGPAEAPVFRLNGYYRYHFQLQSADSALLHDVLRDVLAVVRTPTGVEFQVDVDPFSML